MPTEIHTRKRDVELAPQNRQERNVPASLLLVVAFGSGVFGIGSQDDAAGVAVDAAF